MEVLFTSIEQRLIIGKVAVAWRGYRPSAVESLHVTGAKLMGGTVAFDAKGVNELAHHRLKA